MHNTNDGGYDRAMQLRRSLFIGSLLVSCYVAVAGCGDDGDSESPPVGSDATADTTPADSARSDTAPQSDGRSPEYTGSACTVASDCYGDIDAGGLKGAPVCIDKV